MQLEKKTWIFGAMLVRARDWWLTNTMTWLLVALLSATLIGFAEWLYPDPLSVKLFLLGALAVFVAFVVPAGLATVIHLQPEDENINMAIHFKVRIVLDWSSLFFIGLCYVGWLAYHAFMKGNHWEMISYGAALVIGSGFLILKARLLKK